MAKTKDFRVIPCVGAVLMSAGLALASFSTSVSIVFKLIVARTSVPHASIVVRHRSGGSILPRHHLDTSSFRCASWTSVGYHHVRRWVWWVSPCSGYQGPHVGSGSSMDATVAGAVEPFEHIPYWICDEKQRRTGG